MKYIGIGTAISILCHLSDWAYKKFGTKRQGIDEMGSAPPSAGMDSPPSTTTEAFDLLRNGEEWEMAPVNTMDIQSSTPINTNGGSRQKLPLNSINDMPCATKRTRSAMEMEIAPPPTQLANIIEDGDQWINTAGSMSAAISIDPNGMALAMQILPTTWWITSLLLKIYGMGSIIMTLCTIAVIVAKRFGSKRSKIKEMEVTDMTPPPQRIETPTSTATSAYDLLRDDEWDAMTIASEATIYQNGHVTDDNASDSDGTESDIYDDEWAAIMAAENIQDIRDISHPPSATPQNGVIYPPSQDQLAAAESRLRACGVLLGRNDIGEFALDPDGLRQQYHNNESIIDAIDDWVDKTNDDVDPTKTSDDEEDDELKRFDEFMQWLEDPHTQIPSPYPCEGMYNYWEAHHCNQTITQRKEVAMIKEADLRKDPSMITDRGPRRITQFSQLKGREIGNELNSNQTQTVAEIQADTSILLDGNCCQASPTTIIPLRKNVAKEAMNVLSDLALTYNRQLCIGENERNHRPKLTLTIQNRSAIEKLLNIATEKKRYQYARLKHKYLQSKLKGNLICGKAIFIHIFGERNIEPKRNVIKWCSKLLACSFVSATII